MTSTALRATPHSHSEVCDTFRAAGRTAARADSGTKRLIHLFVFRPIRNRLVGEHCSEGRPTSIKDGLRHVGFGEPGGVYVTDSDVIERSNDAGREFVQMVPPSVGDFGVDLCRLTLLSRALSNSEFVSQLRDVARILNLFAIRHAGQVFQPEVDSYGVTLRPRLCIWYLNRNVDVPTSASVLGEAPAICELSSMRNRAGVEHSVRYAEKCESAAYRSYVPAFERNPQQRLLAAIAKKWPLRLLAGLGVDAGKRTDAVCMDAKFFGTPGGQLLKIKRARPLLRPSKSVFLSVIEEVPHEVDCARLPYQGALVIFYSVSVRKDHPQIIPERAV